jgi:serine/threonine protein kinase
MGTEPDMSEWMREPNTEPIPGYRIIEPLGKGGFGEVWKCEVPGGIFKAMKFVYGNLNTVDSDSAKAEQELKALEKVKAVRHPFVLSMDMIKILQGELVIVMELADKSLYEVLEEYQKEGRPGIPRDILLGFMADAAEGLDHMIEKHNLQHLDVKPKNLFLIADRVKVADFGLVSAVERSSSTGMMAGITPVYTSPETFQNKISKQSDQYSLAIVYHELLTGKWTFNGKNVRQLAMQHLTQPPDLSALPDVDRPVVGKALSKNPEDRYPSCLAFVRALIANSMNDASGSGSLYNTSAGLRHVVASQADFQLPDMMRATPAPIVATPGPPPAPPKPVAPSFVPPMPRPGFAPSLPGLVNPKAATAQRYDGNAVPSADPMSRPIPGRPATSASPRIGMPPSMLTTTNSRPASGVLRPTLLVGIGSFGMKALEQIRGRLLDRLGPLEDVPCVRFLCLDSIPESSESPLATGLDPDQIVNLPMQPSNSYRRKQLDQLLEWLPKEKLHAIPRSLTIDGNRAYGRLAFCDHSMRVFTRLRNELQAICHPDALATASDKTGLTVLTRTPAVHIFASASGGTGGMLIDAGYCVRRAMDKVEGQRGPVTAFVFAGATQDINTPASEQSNIMATLVELNHYADPDVAFTGQYGGPDGIRVEETGPPFSATYLLSMQERTKASFEDCIANLAGYVIHDLTTPLGATLEKVRRAGPGHGRSPFRQFGTFGLWYPRGLVIREAARQLCAELVLGWGNPTPAIYPAEVDRSVHKILGDARLAPDQVARAIDSQSIRRKMESESPATIVQNWINAVAADSDDETKTQSGWAKAVLTQTAEFVGMQPTDEQDSKFQRGKLSQALDRGVVKLSESLGVELLDAVRPLAEIPGVGLAACEYAIQQLTAACQSTTHSLETKLRDLGQRRKGILNAVQAAANGTDSFGSSLSIFGNRTAKSKKSFGEKIKQFVELRVEEDLAVASIRFYQKVSERLAGMLSDLATCRQHLSDLYRELAAPFTSNDSTQGGGDDPSGLKTTLKMTNTIRIVLPNGEERVDRAASEMLERLSAEDRQTLEYFLHRNVLEPRGGLISVSKTVSNLSKHLAGPLLAQTAAYLGDRVPAEDVTAIEAVASRGRPDGFAKRIEGYLRAAGGHVVGPAADAKIFLTLPDSPTGRQFGDAVKSMQPTAEPLVVANHRSDLLFCREQDWLRQTDLRDLVSTCWDAYAEACGTIESSPHVRFDVSQWIPLIAEPANRW